MMAQRAVHHDADRRVGGGGAIRALRTQALDVRALQDYYAATT